MKNTLKIEDIKKEPIKTVIVEDVNKNYLPIEDLPSKYRFYKTDKIFARPLNVSEVKYLATMDEDNYNIVMNDVLKKTTRGIDVDDILVGDKYFLIFWLRANTYKNSGYELDFHCSVCEKNSKYNFGIELLDVKYVDDGFDPNLEKVLPNSGDKITIKCKTIRDENKVRDFSKRTKTAITKYDDEIIEISSNLNRVNGEELSVLNKYEYVEKMHPSDFAYLISYVDSITFGVKSEIGAVCNTCKEKTQIRVTFRPEFFIPKYNV